MPRARSAGPSSATPAPTARAQATPSPAVRTWDRSDAAYRRFAAVDCEFTPDGSRFSRHRMPDGSPRYVLLRVDFLMRQGDLTAPIRDHALARLLRAAPGARVPLSAAAAAVSAAAVSATPAVSARPAVAATPGAAAGGAAPA